MMDRYDRRERPAAREQADAHQAAVGAAGPLPDRQNRASRGAAPAAGPAFDAGLAGARSRPHAKYFPPALAARRLRRGRKSGFFGILQSFPRNHRRNLSPTSIA